MEAASAVTLMGRIDSADVFSDDHARWPSGYVLQLNHDGSWVLFSAKFKHAPQTLASGSLGGSAMGWHKMRLGFQGTNVTASVDGRELAAVKDDSHVAGMVAIGTDWGTAQFDNLAIGQ